MELLFLYLKETGETAIRRMESLEAELLRKNSASDKATQQMVWVQRMNMMKAHFCKTEKVRNSYF